MKKRNYILIMMESKVVLAVWVLMVIQVAIVSVVGGGHVVAPVRLGLVTSGSNSSTLFRKTSTF